MTNDEFFETVVVGSGFGGSVAALRLAEANAVEQNGARVCLLERGRAFAPGEFARAPWDLARNFWEPRKGQQGLFDVWSFRHCEAVVSAGLGGGSLIYSNALVRPPADWINEWPIAYGDLERHFGTVETMLGGQPFPAGQPGYAGVRKAAVMEDAAKQVNKHADFEFVKLAVSFRGDGGALGVGLPLATDPGNYHVAAKTGHGRTSCTLCCQCNIGCNQGSKNTLDHNYLSQAQQAGVAIRTRCEVKEIKTLGEAGENGYRVGYVEHRVDAEGQPITCSEVQTVRCRRLILSAGALGTTYLLLRNKGKGNLERVSDVLGQRFSTNGDYLMWMTGVKKPDGRPLHLYPSVGLPVTMAIKYKDFYIEDAGYPVIVDWLMAAKSGLILRAIAFLFRYLWATITHSASGRISNQLAVVIGQGGAAVADSMPLGGMGLDKPDGQMSLRKETKWFFFRRHKRLSIEWSMNNSIDYFNRVALAMMDISDKLNATKIVPSGLSRLNRTITVHPLGGCPMGVNREDGVCDRYGEVFGYPNLFIADGSVMPSPIGANPSLTIAAFSEHMVQSIVDNKTSVHFADRAVNP